MSTIVTVMGPVSSESLGVVLPHEHTFLDLSCLWHAPRDGGRQWLIDKPVSNDIYTILSEDPYHSKDNLHLDDEDAVAEELISFREAGGNAVIDLSTLTIGPYPQELRDLSTRTGLHIVAGTGFYVQRAHPTWVRDASWEQLYEHMLRDLRDGIKESNIRAGIIGELGTSSPVHPDEMKVLRAAAAVQREYPVGINVHLSIFASEGLKVLDALEAYGADLSRVALSHIDENLDLAYHLALAERGVFMEFDTWGSECRFQDSNTREPTDNERMVAFQELAERGYMAQLLLSQDVCTKMQWHRHGGRGYDHILRLIVPRLRQSGFSDGDIEQMMVVNPVRLLTADWESSAS